MKDTKVLRKASSGRASYVSGWESNLLPPSLLPQARQVRFGGKKERKKDKWVKRYALGKKERQ